MTDDKKAVNVKSLKKEIDDFKEEQTVFQNKVLGVLETLINKDKKIGDELPKEVEQVAAAPLSMDLTPAMREIFEKYFDPADGFKAAFNSEESTFIIEVPENLSNASDAHKKFYKQDLRVRKVDQNNVLGSIEHYCALVCQNLKYNRKLRLK